MSATVSFVHGPVGHRHAVAALLVLAVSFPVAAARPVSRVGWDAVAGPSRFAAVGRTPGSPVALRPTDGNADPQGHGYTRPEPARVRTASVRALGERRRPTRRPRSTATATGSPDQVESTLHAFETAWRVEVVRMGFRAPKPDGTSADHGPNDELDVYLADVGALGLSGYVATDDPRADDDGYQYRDYSAYVVVDDDFSVAQLGASGGPGGLRATAAHEFFHAVQFAYDSSEDAWLTEGTAVWMEDRVADDVDANRRWLRSSALVHPWVPIDSSRGMNEYGAWIFWRFLTESDGVARPGPDDHPPRVGAGRGRPRRSRPVLGARGPAGAQRPRPLAGGRARDVRRVEPGAGGVLRRGLRVSLGSRLPAAPRERAPSDRGMVDDQGGPPRDGVRVVRCPAPERPRGRRSGWCWTRRGGAPARPPAS